MGAGMTLRRRSVNRDDPHASVKRSPTIAPVLDALYIQLDGDHGQAFRFRPDGTVLDVLLRKSRGEEWGDLSVVHQWLDAGKQGVVVGRYTLEGKKVRLETVGHFGDGERVTVWEGRLSDEKMVLDFFDHASSRRGKGLVFLRIARPRKKR